MKQLRTFLFSSLFMAGLVFAGCSASDEPTHEKTQPPAPPQPSATEMMTKEMTTLKTQNDSLQQEITKVEQNNRLTTARAAELETQVAELKEKLTAPPPKVTKPAIGNTLNYYEQALQIFRARKYQEAATMLQGILDAGTPPGLEDNCHYWLGECSYAVKNYNDALEHFQHVFTYNVSEKKDDAQIMIANCYLGLGNKAKAKAEYQKLIDKYPASPYAKRAKERLGKL